MRIHHCQLVAVLICQARPPAAHDLPLKLLWRVANQHARPCDDNQLEVHVSALPLASHVCDGAKGLVCLVCSEPWPAARLVCGPLWGLHLANRSKVANVHFKEDAV